MMKIALLVPEKNRSFNDPTYSLFISQLPEVLKKAGFDFKQHLIPMDSIQNQETSILKILSSLRIFFSETEGIDLIHNLLGPLPLYLNPTPTIPLLTTFFEQPDKETVSLITSPPPLFFFTTASEKIRITGENNMGVIRPTEIEERIPALYEKISQLTRREDHRPWGYYVVLADETDHKVKRIVVWPGKRLSLQRHRRRSEHWHIVQGEAIVTLDGEQIPLRAGESVDIPQGTAHRIKNSSKTESLVFIEVQRGDYFGEDDIERLEDDYGRA